MEQKETFGCLSHQDGIHACMASEPSQLLLIYTDLFWMLYFLNFFLSHYIILYLYFTPVTPKSVSIKPSIYMSKENTFLRQNMATILFRYMLQFSYASNPTELEAFAKLSVFNNSLHN